MKPLKILSDEHVLIRQALENFTLAAERLQQGERPPVVFFRKAIQFIRDFVQTFHHFKEEHVMFVRLAQKKHGEIDAQIDALKNQHEHARELVAGMVSALEGYAEGEELYVGRLLENLVAYSALLQRHIHLEDHVFYPMVATTLDEAEMNSLVDEFKRESQKSPLSDVQYSRRLVEEMGTLLVEGS